MQNTCDVGVIKIFLLSTQNDGVSFLFGLRNTDDDQDDLRAPRHWIESDDGEDEHSLGIEIDLITF